MYEMLGFGKGAIVLEGSRWHDRSGASGVSGVVVVPGSAVFGMQGLW